MSPAAVNASPEKSHHTETLVRSAAPRPTLAKQPRPAAAHNEALAPTSPAATTIVSAPAIPPATPAAAPSTPAQALALQSSYGNAAVARAASTGELRPAAAAEPASKGAAPPAESPSTKSVIAAPTSASQTPGNIASPAAPLPAQTLPATAVASAAPAVTPDAAAASAPTTAAASTPSAGGSAPAGKATGPAALAAKPAEKSAGAHAGGAKHETDQHAKPAPAAAGSAGASGARSRSAANDPAFQSVVKHAKAVAHHQATHGSAKGKAAEASAAAVPPGNEVSSRAAARQTATMEAQKPKRFNREAFKSSLLGKIKAPSTLKEADNFKENNNLGEVKTSVNSQVADQKQQSQGALPQKVAENPDASGIDPKPVTPLPDAGIGQGQGVAAAGAAPKPADNSEIDLSAGPKEVDKQMSDAQVTDEQLEKSNEPAFQSAAGEKKNLQKQSAEAPREYRKQEKTALVASAHQAQAIANKHTHEMHGARKHALTAVSAHQAQAKEEEEKKRKEVSDHIESIYQKVKSKVEARLSQLDKDVNKTFDDGADGARAAFESYVEVRMDAYKDDRYSGVTGKARWVKDKFLGMPDFVNTFYEKGKDLFIQHMSEVIDRVATLVEAGLNESMDIIASGKAEIDHYVNVELPSNLKSFGQKAATGIQSKFESLEQSVNDKQDQLAESLAQKYSENMEKLNSRIEEMKAANRGLVDAVLDAVVGVIKTILQLKDMLLNVLARAASAIGMIIAHPIDFLGNLVEAGKQGFSNFVDHILEHLKQGFMEWLFGAVAETGIQLPKNFDLPGILSLVLQVLGLTYSNIRSRAVKILGEKVVKALETAAEIFKILITKGPGGLWEYIKEKIGDLKSMVIEKIKSFIMEKVVMAGITWIIGLLNPASAFIKACKAIYDIIMFFVEHGKQILDLVNAIIDSITAIAKGQIGAAAAWVEKSLARTIPVVIGFLAGLLGVGGISEKIKEVIEMVRKPINEAIDWVITKAVDLVKAVGGLLGFGKKDEPVAKTNDPEHDAKVQAGLAAIDEEDAKHVKDGKITQQAAEEVAGTVKKAHPVFKSLTVVEGQETWDYDYVASPGQKKPGAKKAGAASQAELEKQVNPVEPNYASVDGLGRPKPGPEGFPPKRVLGGDREALPPIADLPGGATSYQPGDHRGHLIGDRFGGQAVEGNLVPMHPVLNLSTFKTFENKIAAAYEKWKKDRHAALVWMHIIPAYSKNEPGDPESYRPTSVHGSFKIHSLDDKGDPPKAIIGESGSSGKLDNPDSGQRRKEINLNTAGRAELTEIPGVGPELADRIVNERRKGPFRRYMELVERVPGIGEKTLEKIRGEDPLIRVRLLE
ncbi:MAG TPA: helix-hairpin-helix domain-containing protein [Candidatus Acidoferrum sp.]|nr:helix-hairpin-helix domain-containing protein [Candidatus Acidoferrum sp.]